MAKQDSFGMLIGTIGGVTFYKRGDKYYAREAGNGKRIPVDSDPRMVRRDEGVKEFRLATKHSWGIRTALRGLVYGIMDGGNSGRLTGKLRNCIKSNPVGERGNRKLYPATLSEYLEGHEFNSRSILPLNFELYDTGGLSVNLDRVTGVAEVTFAAHDSMTDINAPGLADFYDFTVGVAWWDGTEKDVQGSVRCGWRGTWMNSARINVNAGAVSDTVIQASFPAGFTGLLVVVSGVRYWKDDGTTDGFWLRIQSSLRVVAVSPS